MSLDQFVPIDVGFLPESAIWALTTIQSERRTFLMCNAVRTRADGLRAPCGVGIYRFGGCLVSAYGWPNDEAAGAHPLFKGAVYGLYEIPASPWFDWLVTQNRFAFPELRWSTRRHFVVTGHDSSFNCLAETVTAEVVPTWQQAMDVASAVVLAD
jgi:hypothetical protein